MNENEKVIAALGESEVTNGSAKVDGDANLKALETAKHSSDVWAGRAKKLAEEKALLEEELRKLKSVSIAKEEADKLTEDELNGTPREFVEAGGRVAANMVAAAAGKTDEEIRKLRAEIDERDKNMFFSQIGMQNSRFFDAIGPGGDKSEMWNRFKASNLETYEAVMRTHDVSRFNMLVNAFYREIGVPNPSGVQGGSAAPEPRATVGGVNGGNVSFDEGRTYTTDEYLSALESAEDEFRRTGDRKSYEAKTAMLNKALNDGRVK